MVTVSKLLRWTGDIEFDEEALGLIAQKLSSVKPARGLRAILEDIMLNVMYEILLRDDIENVITKDTILNRQEPMLIIADSQKPRKSAKSLKKRRKQHPDSKHR